MMYIRYPLSLRQVEDLLFERGIDICHETVRFWWNRFGPMFAAEIRKRRVHQRSYSHWRWHLDEVFVRINGDMHYLWRAVDHEGEVLEVFATKRRDRQAALKFLRRAMKRYGRPESIVTDRLRSYGAAMKVIGNVERQQCGRWLTAELSEHLPGPAIYRLYFPLDAHPGVRERDMDDARRRLTGWILEHAQRLNEAHPERPTRERNPRGFEDRYRGTPPEFPYEVTMERESHWSLPSRHDGILHVSRIAPEEVEEQRAVRLREALERKCPKLGRCKEEGARTVLVLEDADMFLSNHVVIGDGLVSVMEGRTDLPDEIYLVETSVNTWGVQVMKCDEVLLPELEWLVFDSAALENLTGR